MYYLTSIKAKIICLKGGYQVPKDTDCIIYTFALHQDDRYFPDPDKFNPDRFLPENCLNKHPYSYVPFSAGRRNCIGQRFAMMEIKVILANILRKFEMKSLKTIEELQPLVELVLKPANGLPVQLTMRKNKYNRKF